MLKVAVWVVALWVPVAVCGLVLSHGNRSVEPFFEGMALIAGVLVGSGIVLGLLHEAVRAVASPFAGEWACRHGWHWYKRFPIHTANGVTSRTTTYLAIHSKTIYQRRDCKVYEPKDGEHIVTEYNAGRLRMTGEGFFTAPKGLVRSTPNKE